MTIDKLKVINDLIEQKKLEEEQKLSIKALEDERKRIERELEADRRRAEKERKAEQKRIEKEEEEERKRINRELEDEQKRVEKERESERKRVEDEQRRVEKEREVERKRIEDEQKRAEKEREAERKRIEKEEEDERKRAEKALIKQEQEQQQERIRFERELARSEREQYRAAQEAKRKEEMEARRKANAAALEAKKKAEAEVKAKKNPVIIIREHFDFIRIFNKAYVAMKTDLSNMFYGKDIPCIFFEDREWYTLENKTTISHISNLVFNLCGTLSAKTIKEAVDLQDVTTRVIKFEELMMSKNSRVEYIEGKTTVEYVIDALFLPRSEAERNALHRKLKYFLRYVYQFWTEKFTMIDVAVIIAGKQGIGKSSFAKFMAGMYDPDMRRFNLFTDGELDFENDKKLGEVLEGKLVAELGEIKALTKAGSEDIKRNISKENDSYRKAYDAHCRDQKRTTAFVGTTNYTYGLLRDPTGNRRWIICTSNREKNDSAVPSLLRADWFAFWKEISLMPPITNSEREMMQNEFNAENEQFVAINSVKEHLMEYVNDSVLKEEMFGIFDEKKNRYSIGPNERNQIWMAWSEKILNDMMIKVNRFQHFDNALYEILSRHDFEVRRPGNKITWIRSNRIKF
jgi:chemotaxis protein histidine kinase CheA